MYTYITSVAEVCEYLQYWQKCLLAIYSLHLIPYLNLELLHVDVSICVCYHQCEVKIPLTTCPPKGQNWLNGAQKIVVKSLLAVALLEFISFIAHATLQQQVASMEVQNYSSWKSLKLGLEISLADCDSRGHFSRQFSQRPGLFNEYFIFFSFSSIQNILLALSEALHS